LNHGLRASRPLEALKFEQDGAVPPRPAHPALFPDRAAVPFKEPGRARGRAEWRRLGEKVPSELDLTAELRVVSFKREHESVAIAIAPAHRCGSVAAMDLYYSKVSGNSSRAAFGLYEIGIPFTPHHIDMPGGENRGAAYLALNPTGKVPAMVDGDFQLWESNAINWYAAEKNPKAGLLPASIAGRAAVQRWLLFQVGHVTPACVPLFFVTNERVRKYWGDKGTPQAAETGRKELARFLPVLEQALATREWLEGDFSLADIAFVPHLWLVAEGGYDFASTPGVRAWLERMLARPAWQKAMQLIFAV